jgi:tRNA (cytidine/uridine-2'-O-)-methyltransferase
MLHVVLVEPEIPPNTGNVARLCAATGTMLHLVEPLGFRVDDKSLKRAGLDYWKYLIWKTWPNFLALREAYPEGRFWLVETGTTRSYDEVEYRDGDFLVFGRESKGLAPSITEAMSESLITIPMTQPAVRSLNLSNCAAIVLFEALRQQRRGVFPAD